MEVLITSHIHIQERGVLGCNGFPVSAILALPKPGGMGLKEGGIGRALQDTILSSMGC